LLAGRGLSYDLALQSGRPGILRGGNPTRNQRGVVVANHAGKTTATEETP